MQCFLGIDLGTSYFKFGLYDQNMKLKGLSNVAVQKDTKDGHSCLLPSQRFTELIKKGLSNALKHAQITAEKINYIGFSSQANSFIMLDKNLNPLTPIILWPDLTFTNLHPRVKELWHRPDFLQRTGLGIDPPPNLCINKLSWIKDTKADLWRKVKKVMTISDYLSYLLSGEEVGDLGTASLLGLLDCQNRKWWDHAFKLLDIDKNLFSKRLPPGSAINSCRGTLTRELGIKTNTVFAVGSLDHHMAALGAGLTDDANMSLSLGTVVACVNFADGFKPKKGVCISPWKPGKYCQLTFDANGAVSLEWYHKKFAPEISFDKLMNMAEQAESSKGLKALPMAFKYDKKQSAFEGIEDFHNHGHFILALMESCANTAANLKQRLISDKNPAEIFAAGGGAKSKLWLKIISQKTKCKVTRSLYKEPATAGSVRLLQKN